ncbi:MAG: hypothetical protein AAF997_04780 [Myxococcota bacterium]
MAESQNEVAVLELGGDHDASLEAARTLSGGGAPAAQAIEDAWPTLSPLARRRALGVLAVLAEEHDAAVDALVAVARSEDEALTRDALEILAESGRRGHRGLETLAFDLAQGDAAALTLARSDPARALPVLVRALEARGPEAGAELRQAFATAVRRLGDGAETLLLDWVGTEPSPAALANAALALAPLDEQRGTQTAMVEAAVGRPSDFATEWRLAVAASTSGPSAAVDAWLVAQSRQPETWMLRAAAVDALAARDRAQLPEQALEDTYPRVRASAAAAFAGDSSTMTTRATMARRDTWPLVRAAAVTSLQGETQALPVVVAAVDDPMSQVRAAAIAVLVDASEPSGWNRVHARLRRQDEWPEVVEGAIAYVVAHCRRDAVEGLYFVIKRAASPSALTDDVQNAARAVETLRVLGTPEGSAILAQLEASEGVPEPLQMALKRPVSEASRCAERSP